jgi:hypothetical protein
MRLRTNGIARAILGLLESDMHGEFRKGDTIGFWTYDDQIHSDLPMLVWSKENKESVTEDVMRYLRHQKYDGHAHLDKVLSTIGQVLQQSERVTIILIHDGSDKIHGTEFDSDINELQEKHFREFRAAHLPMVTVLAARGSIVYDYTINHPDSISIPHTAFAEPPPETNNPPVQAIVAPVAPAPPPRHIAIIMAGTNHLAHELTPTELAALTSSTPAPSNAIAAPSQQSQPPPTDSTAASTPTPAPTVASDSQSTTPTPEPVATKSEPVAPAPSPVIAQSAPASLTTPAPPAAVDAVAPASGIAQSAESQQSTEATSHAPTSAPISTVAAAPSSSVPSPETAAITVPPAGQQAALFIIAISLLTIAVVLVVFLVRRWRGDAAGSLISQSMDRGR